MQNLEPKLQQPAAKNICHTCGTRFSLQAPDRCPVCMDERQYVPFPGQTWISYDELKKTRTIRMTKLLDSLYDLRIHPSFSIGQKAHLIITDEGNLLWDCLPFLDEQTVAFIQAKGGLSGIAISHPHYYSLMTAWAETFHCPVYLHQSDSAWIMDNSEHLTLWSGDRHSLFNNMQIIHTGGHFAGSTVLHAPGTGSSGSLFVGDSLQIAPSQQFISMMYSYPNIIPLPLHEILYIHRQVNSLHYDAMFGAFEWQNLYSGAKQVFNRSVERYVAVYKG